MKKLSKHKKKEKIKQHLIDKHNNSENKEDNVDENQNSDDDRT